MTKKGVIYTSPKGWDVTDLSNSMFNEYSESPAKFKWRRIYGIREKHRWATMEFGHAIQRAVQSKLKTPTIDPVEVFEIEWDSRSADPSLVYSPSTSQKKLMEQGRELMKVFNAEAKKYNFQNMRFPELRDSEKIRVLDPNTGCYYVSIPDMICTDIQGPLICDIKALAKGIPTETPGLVVNDMQLRTQASLTKIYRVALWVFSRSPESPPKPSVKQLLDMTRTYGIAEDIYQLEILRQVLGFTIEEGANALRIEKKAASGLAKEMLRLKKEPQVTVTLGVMNALLDELETALTPVYKIQWIESRMKAAWADEAVQDQLKIIPEIQKGCFPCRCSVRYPKDDVHDCPFRGLCLSQAVADPTAEQKKAWDEITRANLVQFDAKELGEL